VSIRYRPHLVGRYNSQGKPLAPLEQAGLRCALNAPPNGVAGLRYDRPRSSATMAKADTSRATKSGHIQKVTTSYISGILHFGYPPKIGLAVEEEFAERIHRSGATYAISDLRLLRC
jgi:hypothetical protein